MATREIVVTEESFNGEVHADILITDDDNFERVSSAEIGSPGLHQAPETAERIRMSFPAVHRLNMTLGSAGNSLEHLLEQDGGRRASAQRAAQRVTNHHASSFNIKAAPPLREKPVSTLLVTGDNPFNPLYASTKEQMPATTLLRGNLRDPSNSQKEDTISRSSTHRTSKVYQQFLR